MADINVFVTDAAVKGSLQLLKDKGMKSGVFTGLDREEAEFILKKMGLKQFFDVIVTVDDVEKLSSFAYADKIYNVVTSGETADESVISPGVTSPPSAGPNTAPTCTVRTPVA